MNIQLEYPYNSKAYCVIKSTYQNGYDNWNSYNKKQRRIVVSGPAESVLDSRAYYNPWHYYQDGKTYLMELNLNIVSKLRLNGNSTDCFRF